MAHRVTSSEEDALERKLIEEPPNESIVDARGARATPGTNEVVELSGETQLVASRHRGEPAALKLRGEVIQVLPEGPTTQLPNSRRLFKVLLQHGFHLCAG